MRAPRIRDTLLVVGVCVVVILAATLIGYVLMAGVLQ